MRIPPRLPFSSIRFISIHAGLTQAALAKMAVAAVACVCCMSCQLPWSGAGKPNCADGARLDFPVDLSAYAAKGAIWPHGVHGGTHPEGHPGIDFILDAEDVSADISVRASFSAEVISITPETEYPGSSCIVMDSACVEVNLCHLHLDSSVAVGSQVARGQRLGTVGYLAQDHQYSLHFGTYSGADALQSCPADFLDPDTVRCRLGLAVGDTAASSCGNLSGTVTLMGRSSYPEQSARDFTVTCADGSTETFSMPPETKLCNAKLDAADRDRMNACLGSACAGVW